MSNQEINIVIKAVDKFTKNFSKVNRGLNKMSDKLKKNSARFKKMSAIWGVSFTGMAYSMKKLTDAYNVQLWAEKQVQQWILSTGWIAGKTLEWLKKQASDLQKTSIFWDEDILQNVSAQFLTFWNVTWGVFDRAQQATLDLTTRLYWANASWESMKSTSIQLGKALNDPIKWVSALSRVWVSFTEQQKEQIKALTESWKLQKAQWIILKELEIQYWWSAKAAADALWPTHQLWKSLWDLKEVVWKWFKESIDRISKKLSPILEKISVWANENEKLVKWIGIIGVATAWLVAVVGGLGLILPSIITGVTALGTAFTLLTWPIGLIVTAIAGFGIAYKTNFLWFGDFVNATVERVKPLFEAVVFWIQQMYMGIKMWIDRVKEPFMQVINFLKPYVLAFLTLLKKYFTESFGNIVTILKGSWDIMKWVVQVAVGLIWGIIEVFLKLITGDWEWAWNGVKQTFSLVWEGIKNIAHWATGVVAGILGQFKTTVVAMFWGIASWVKGIVSGIYESVVGKFTGMMDRVQGIYNKVQGWLGKILGAENRASKSANSIKYQANKSVGPVVWQRAFGGDVTAGKTYWVWERWPEKFTPAVSGTITPTASSSWAWVTLNFWDVILRNDMDEQTFFRKVERVMTDVQRKGSLWFN